MCPRSREQGNIRIAKAPCRTHGSADTALLRSACAGWLADALPSCSARLHCQCRTRGKLRSLVRTGERSAPAVQCARRAWSIGAFTYWMCGEGGQRAERCATTRVVSQGNTCAHEWPHPSPDRGAQCACRAMCHRSMEQGELLHIGCAGRAVIARSAAPLRVW